MRIAIIGNNVPGEIKLSEEQIKQIDPSLEVVLISTADKIFLFSEKDIERLLRENTKLQELPPVKREKIKKRIFSQFVSVKIKPDGQVNVPEKLRKRLIRR
jgi:hypothetical protein